VTRSVRDDFSEFVAARGPALQRTAFLLTGDWGRAEDLLQSVLVKALRHWPRVSAGSPEAYVRTALARSAVSSWRRRWNGEVPSAALPEGTRDAWPDVDRRQVIFDALRQLPPRQRAVIVLRFYEDLTETAVAEALGVSVGTVKSQSAKALQRLRANPQMSDETRTAR
jgi:RNA polymerase sigma-70 factor (sigma-E family)